MEETQKNTAIWYTVGAIVIVFLGYWLFFRTPAATVVPTENEIATTTSQVTSTPSVVELTVNDQFSTSTVTVDKVVTNAPAWVVIHEDRAGKPGNILGASWVPANKENLNIEISLLRAAVEGQTYYAMIHADDGNGGSNFDLKTDLPMTDATGNPIMKAYKVIFGKG